MNKTCIPLISSLLICCTSQPTPVRKPIAATRVGTSSDSGKTQQNNAKVYGRSDLSKKLSSHVEFQVREEPIFVISNPWDGPISLGQSLSDIELFCEAENWIIRPERRSGKSDYWSSDVDIPSSRPDIVLNIIEWAGNNAPASVVGIVLTSDKIGTAWDVRVGDKLGKLKPFGSLDDCGEGKGLCGFWKPPYEECGLEVALAAGDKREQRKIRFIQFYNRGSRESPNRNTDNEIHIWVK